MMAAVDFRHHALVEWLLERGANVNARAELGLADRRRCTRRRGTATCRWSSCSIRAGADRAARDEEHDGTPLGWAETSIEVTNNPACAEVVAYLDQGAEPR